MDRRRGRPSAWSTVRKGRHLQAGKDSSACTMRGSGVGVSTETVSRVAEKFQLAGLGGMAWDEAVGDLAALAGASAGELIGLGADAAVPFNLITGHDADVSERFIAAGGGDPNINSRVRIGGRARELEVLDETAFTTAEDMARHEPYADWIHRYDFASICLTPLVRDEGLLVGLAVIRTAKQGLISPDEKRAFAEVAAHARGAVRTQLLLQRRSLEFASGLLDAIGACVFLCDPMARVLAMSESAERLLADGRHLKLVHGQLAAAVDSAQPGLQSMIGEAANPASPPRTGPIPLPAGDGGALLVEAAPVPRSHPIGLGVAALVIVHQPGENRRRVAEAATALFGLTPAEASVAAQLALGRSVAGIAGAGGVSVQTVRSHLKRIFDKADVRSQSELASKLARFG